MLAIRSHIAAVLSPAPNLQVACLLLRRLPLIVGLGLCGCHARPAATATSLTSVRSLNGPSSAIAQVQSAPLYRLS